MSPVSQTNEWDDEKCQVRVQECLDLSTEPTLGNSLVCGDAISQTWPAGALLCANRSVQWRYESSIRRVPGASHTSVKRSWLRSPVMLSIEITFPRIAPFSWK